MNIERTLTKEFYNGMDVIRSVDITSGMMGGNDTLLVDAKTLLPVARNIKQGMGTVHLKFENGKVEGMLEAGPQKLPINVNVDVPIVSDGVGIDMMIESLAFSENSTVKFYQLDLMSAKTKVYILKVVGSEKISVPAGEFETYKVDIKELSGEGEPTHKWVNKSNGKTVKTITKLGAQMGGGTVTIELTK